MIRNMLWYNMLLILTIGQYEKAKGSRPKVKGRLKTKGKRSKGGRGEG